MSIIEPKIDELLDRTDNDRFLLCALASKRAHDINDMMRGQRDRAIQLQTAVEIARAADKKPLSLAFGEIARGEVSYDPGQHRHQEPLELGWPAASGACRHRERPQHRTLPLARASLRAKARAAAWRAIFDAGAVRADLHVNLRAFVRERRVARGVSHD